LWNLSGSKNAAATFPLANTRLALQDFFKSPNEMHVATVAPAISVWFVRSGAQEKSGKPVLLWIHSKKACFQGSLWRFNSSSFCVQRGKTKTSKLIYFMSS